MVTGKINTIEKQINVINNTFKDTINYFDLNFRADSEVDRKPYPRPLILEQGQALVSAVKLWCQSSKYDYVRRPHFAGFFDYNLNDRWALKKENEESVKNALISAIVVHFSNIEVLNCTVEAQPTRRAWHIELMVRDTLTNLVGMDNDINIQTN